MVQRGQRVDHRHLGRLGQLGDARGSRSGSRSRRRSARAPAPCRRSTRRARAASRRRAGRPGARRARRRRPRRRSASGSRASRRRARRCARPARRRRRRSRAARFQLRRPVEQLAELEGAELFAGEEVPLQAGGYYAARGVHRHRLEPLSRARLPARPGAAHLALAAAADRRAQRDPRPGQPRPDAPSSPTLLAGAEWDVALLQECPPRFAEPLAAACGGRGAPGADLAQRARRRCAACWRGSNPDLMASGEGGSNLTLVRVPGRLGGIAERREMAIHEGEPERRAMALGPHRLRRLRRQPARDQRPAAAGRRGRAAGGAGGDRVGRRRAAVFGGDLNLRPAEQPAGLRAAAGASSACAPPTAPEAIDQCSAAASRCSSRRPHGRRERRELPLDGRALRLSDHAPVEARFAAAEPSCGIEIVERPPDRRPTRRQTRWPRKKPGRQTEQKSESRKPKAKKAQSESAQESRAEKSREKTPKARAKNRREKSGDGKASQQSDERPRQERRPVPREPRAERDPQPRPHPGGRRRRRQTRPDDPHRRRENAQRAGQTGPQTDRLAAEGARAAGQTGAQRGRRTRSRCANRPPRPRRAAKNSADAGQAKPAPAPSRRAARAGDRLARLRRARRRPRRGLRRLRRRGAAGRPRPRRGDEGEEALRRGADGRAAARPAPTASPTAASHGGEPCPGAPWQGLPYERQLAHKQEQVGEALRRIGGLEGFELEEIVPAVEQWRYRNKLEYSFGERDGEPIARLPRPRALGPDRRRRGLPARLRGRQRGPQRGPRMGAAEAVPAYDGRARRGVLRNLVVREGRRTRPDPDPPGHRQARFPQAAGRPAHDRSRATPAAATARPGCSARSACARSSAGCKFEISHGAFFQTNTEMAERLYAVAAEFAGLSGSERVFDLFCGIGTIGLTMAAQAGEVWGLEIVPEAIADAERNAKPQRDRERPLPRRPTPAPGCGRWSRRPASPTSSSSTRRGPGSRRRSSAG